MDTETAAMRQQTNLIEPSPLLLRVRYRFVSNGGSGQAFDWAVNQYALSFEDSPEKVSGRRIDPAKPVLSEYPPHFTPSPDRHVL